jgi:CubicO group peptidase (beta-lactamase class C family)
MGEPPGLLVSTISLGEGRLTDPDSVAREYTKSFTEPLFEPGSTSSYGLPSFLMLGQIVAEVSGRTYIDYVRDKILGPLGMENTDFRYSTDAMVTKRAAPAIPADSVEEFIAQANDVREQKDGAEFIREIDDRHAWLNPYFVLAAPGGLIGPATDVLRFAQMHLNRGELDGVRILSRESVDQMQEMQMSTTGEPLGFGLSWFVEPDKKHPFVEHAGGGAGLWDLMRLYPKDGVAIVMMSNGSGWDRDRMVDAAANVVFSLR